MEFPRASQLGNPAPDDHQCRGVRRELYLMRYASLVCKLGVQSARRSH